MTAELPAAATMRQGRWQSTAILARYTRGIAAGEALTWLPPQPSGRDKIQTPKPRLSPISPKGHRKPTQNLNKSTCYNRHTGLAPTLPLVLGVGFSERSVGGEGQRSKSGIWAKSLNFGELSFVL